MLKIKAECTQLGLAVEASQDGGKTWQTVQLTKYRERSRPMFGKAHSTFVSPAQDREDYFAEIRGRGIQFEVVNV